MDIFDEKNIAPMLIAENKAPFDDPQWIYELKWDGIRCIVYLDKTGVVLKNKRNKDVTGTYPELGQIHKQIKKRCILDGEIFVMNKGKPDFFEVQRRSLMSNPFKIRLAADKLPVCFVAFDILYLDGAQLTGKPLLERKALLQKNVKESDRIAVSRYIDEKGSDLYKAAEAQGLEGVVAKRKDGKYFFGKRTKDWIKIKALIDEDFIICGYYFKEKGYVSIILGAYEKNRIAYQSHVVMGISRHDFIIISSTKRTGKYSGFPDFEDAVWLEPSLVCTVRYMERTPGGGLRQPVFKGLRDDKTPGECQVRY